MIIPAIRRVEFNGDVDWSADQLRLWLAELAPNKVITNRLAIKGVV
jgi:hypothetical protein